MYVSNTLAKRSLVTNTCLHVDNAISLSFDGKMNFVNDIVFCNTDVVVIQ